MVFVFACYEKGGDSLLTTLAEWWSALFGCIFCGVVASPLTEWWSVLLGCIFCGVVASSLKF
jgi:hypothetical protein